MTPSYILPPALVAYLEHYGCRQPALLQQLREETAAQFTPQPMVAALAGQFLAMLVQLTNAKRILEIGTFTGYSSTWMALHLPEDGHITTLDRDSRTVALAKQYWEKAQVTHKITSIIGDAKETLETLDGPFDLIFIDADKRSYDFYYEASLTLIKTGGLIIIDNTLWDGEVAQDPRPNKQAEALHILNQKIHADTRVTMCLTNVGDGMTLVQKNRT
jgi:predicted O-methyltransferase YrrM